MRENIFRSIFSGKKTNEQIKLFNLRTFVLKELAEPSIINSKTLKSLISIIDTIENMVKPAIKHPFNSRKDALVELGELLKHDDALRAKDPLANPVSNSNPAGKVSILINKVKNLVTGKTWEYFDGQLPSGAELITNESLKTKLNNKYPSLANFNEEEMRECGIEVVKDTHYIYIKNNASGNPAYYNPVKNWILSTQSVKGLVDFCIPPDTPQTRLWKSVTGRTGK